MPSTTSGPEAGAPPPGASAAVARRLAPESVSSGTERAITVDQTNISVVVDETVIVKWFRPPVPHPHPAIDVLEHLRAVGFTDMPAFYGAVVDDDTVTAIASEFVGAALDGWDWLVDELMATASGARSAAELVRSAAAVGTLVSRLHVALATPSPTVPAPVGLVAVDAEAARARDLLDAALECVDGEAATVLQRCATAVRTVIDSWPSGGDTLAMRLHGDLHVGQVLRTADRMVVTDFDGNPLLDADRRHAPRPPAVDVAGLLQSIDHAGRVAQRRSPQHVDLLDILIAESVAAALAAYRHGLASARLEQLLDDRLLWPLRVTQELHELVYASRHLPRWAYAPTATLRSMFGGE